MNPKSGTVITIPRPKGLKPAADSEERPKPFRFAVSWETLLAYPRPMEVVETVSTAVVVAAPPVIVMPMDSVPKEIVARALQVAEPPRVEPGEDEAAWEMVVPKMVRR
jgi:hypothetical protein